MPLPALALKLAKLFAALSNSISPVVTVVNSAPVNAPVLLKLAAVRVIFPVVLIPVISRAPVSTKVTAPLPAAALKLTRLFDALSRLTLPVVTVVNKAPDNAPVLLKLPAVKLMLPVVAIPVISRSPLSTKVTLPLPAVALKLVRIFASSSNTSPVVTVVNNAPLKAPILVKLSAVK